MRHLAILILILLVPFSAAAEDASDFHFDVETDPMAFLLSGHSLHVGVGVDRFRFGLGVFGLEIPEFVHGNEGFDARFDGFGAKLDVFLDEEQYGLFAGVSGSFVRTHIGLSDTNLRVQGSQGTIEGRLGYRFELPGGFYVAPWVSAGVLLGSENPTIGDQTYEHSKLVIFPTIHIGYKSR